MSHVEVDRAAIIGRVVAGEVRQVVAARALGITPRQVRRLCRIYESEGPLGLASSKRGKPSNRTTPSDVRAGALALIRAKYHDFGPTLAHEKLVECEGFDVSLATVRRWMMQEGLWTPRHRRTRVQQPRRRRECRGELVQIDGSDHPWFEDRAPRCTLLVFIDDATSELMELRFSPAEDTFSYFACVAQYLRRHGRPVAFYSDKASIFRVNKKDHGGTGMTQFGRALAQLNIDSICANTAAAKGRVERANRTLQDRLVKELRLAGVTGIDEGNEFLEDYRPAYNQRFRKPPLSDVDVHRPVPADLDLSAVFTLQYERKVSARLTVHYKRTMYVLEPNDFTRTLAGNRVTVVEDAAGGVVICTKDGIALPAMPFDKVPKARVTQGDVVANKLLGAVLQQVRDKQLEADRQEAIGARVHRDRKIVRKRLAKVVTSDGDESAVERFNRLFEG